MILTYKNVIIALLVTAGASFFAGKYQSQPSDETKSSTQVKNDVKTVKEITQVKSPDGTVKTVTRIEQDKKTTKDSQSSTIKNNPGYQYRVGVVFGYDTNKKSNKGVIVSTKLIGPVDFGAYLMENKEYGLVVSWGF